MVGQSNQNRLLVVSYLERGQTIRLDQRSATPQDGKHMKKNQYPGIEIEDELRPEYDLRSLR